MNGQAEVLHMSQKEVDRLAVIQQLEARQIRQTRASDLLGIGVRQIRRLQTKYRQQGAAGLISSRRGRPSRRRLPKCTEKKLLCLSQQQYAGFGPTLLHEKVSEHHGMTLSVESVRQLMIGQGLWQPKQRRTVRHHPMRTRRSCRGELVQIDGSLHDWFEGRAPHCCLLVYIDDATSELLQLHFVDVESTQGYFEATAFYIKKHGRPVSFYSDKHSIFRVNIKEAKESTGETQFSRACRELGIELICAHSPQAKGRVERANKTLQDRLVKEMRLRGISSIEEANKFLPQFVPDYNKRFAIEPTSPIDSHRKNLPAQATLNLIFSIQSTRKLSKNLEISYNNVIYQIETKSPCYSMRHANILVSDRLGDITLIYKNKELSYQTFDKKNRPTVITDSKEINHTVDQRAPQKPKANHPWRRYPVSKPVSPSQPTVV
jgi:transposase